MILSGCRFLIRSSCRQVLPFTRYSASKSSSLCLIGIPETAFPTNHCKYLQQIRCSHAAPDGKADDGKRDGKDDGTDEMSFDEELKQLTVFQRYKKLAKEYCGVDVDLVYIAEMLHLPEGLVKPLRNPNLGKLAIVLMLYKLVSPLRYMSTVYAAIPSIKYLVRRKLIKPVPRLTSKQNIEEQISRIKFKITKKRGED